MPNQQEYEYIDEKLINPELICLVCQKPLENPKSLPCNHVFCASCVTHDSSTNNFTCALCKIPLPKTALEDVNRPLLNMLQRLRIRCTRCGEIGLERGNFDEHMIAACSKINVACSSVDIDCPWTGPREELNNHLITCAYTMIRPKMTEHMAVNQQLRDKLNEQNVQIKQLQDVIEKQTTKLNDFESKRRDNESRVSTLQDEIRDLKRKLAHVPSKRNEIF